MAFYSPSPAMEQILADLVRALELDGRAGLSQRLSITWVRYASPLTGSAGDSGADAAAASALGASWGGGRQRYPASVVKLVYLIAAEAWLQDDLLEDGPELRRALEAMIRDSSNDATGLVLDLLTGTTSGPELPATAMDSWVSQRQLVNRWLGELGWPELDGVNACQKTWSDGPFGREREFYGPEGGNRNRLSTEATARLLQAVMASAIVSPPACARMRAVLARSLDPLQRAADPENQVDGFLGEGLPAAARLWSKAGWMSQARHDAAYVEAEGHAPFLLVAFSEGEACAGDSSLLPEIARRLSACCRLG
ncbi:serine hydrolase [Cyanobium sp. CH-040]|uniref:serine hydrolase n=1 Tax=Cyanobium sp. CH-040 TaxID=2823708 RepID=UPI0020CE1138|nr:serine hydrolase [Cyanobium sp. CH-040]MCP9928551.1 serine hydrolase [Cyanobium sp. CH-040]